MSLFTNKKENTMCMFPIKINTFIPYRSEKERNRDHVSWKQILLILTGFGVVSDVIYLLQKWWPVIQWICHLDNSHLVWFG